MKVLRERAQDAVAVAAERTAQVDAVAEVADARLIPGHHADDELLGCLPREIQCERHARAGVDEEDRRDGLQRRAEHGQVLDAAVVQDFKVTLGQIANELAASVTLT